MEILIPSFFKQDNVHEKNRLQFGHTYRVHLMNAPINQKHAQLIRDNSKEYFTHIHFYAYINSEKNIVGYANKELTEQIGIFPISHCLKIEDLTPDLTITPAEVDEILKTATTEKITFDFSSTGSVNNSPSISNEQVKNNDVSPASKDDEELDLGQMSLF